MRRIVLLLLVATVLAPDSFAAQPETAIEGLNSLQVKGRAAKTGYTRAQFPHWSDPDRNGCDARNDTLKRDLTLLILIMLWHYQMLGKPGLPTLIRQKEVKLLMIHLIYWQLMPN